MSSIAAARYVARSRALALAFLTLGLAFPMGEAAERLPPVATFARLHDTTAVYADGAVYIFGGRDDTGEFGPYETVFRFDPLTYEVRRLPDMPIASAEMAAVWTGEAIYLFGGDGSDRVLRFDPRTEITTTVPTALFPSDRIGGAAYDGSRVWLLVSDDALDVESGGMNEIWTFDPTTGLLLPETETIFAPSQQLVASASPVWTGSKLYMFGGRVVPIGALSLLGGPLSPSPWAAYTVADPATSDVEFFTAPILHWHSDAVYDGRYIWIFPGVEPWWTQRDGIQRFDPATGAFLEIPMDLELYKGVSAVATPQGIFTFGGLGRSWVPPDPEGTGRFVYYDIGAVARFYPPPDPPLDVRAEQGPETWSASLTWSPPTYTGAAPVLGYEVERRNLRDGGRIVHDVEALRSDELGLDPDTPYSMRVRAIGPGGKSLEWSEPTEFRTAAGPPGVPRNLTGGPAEMRGGVGLRWSPPTHDGGAPVVYDVSADGEWIMTVNATNTTVSGLGDNESRSYQVRARNAYAGPWTPSIAATTARPPGPGIVHPFDRTAVAIRVTAKDSPDTGGIPAVGIRLYAGDSPEGLALVHEHRGGIVPNFTFFTDTPLAEGQRRYYAASVLTGWGEGPLGAVFSEATKRRPLTPTGISATPRIPHSSLGVEVQWDHATPGDPPSVSYEVLLVEDDGTTRTKDPGASNRTDFPIEWYNTTANITVRARNSVGWTNWSSAVLYRAPPGPPQSPQLDADRVANGTRVLLTAIPRRDGGATIERYMFWETPADGCSQVSRMIYDGPNGSATDLAPTGRRYCAKVWNTHGGSHESSAILAS